MFGLFVNYLEAVLRSDPEPVASADPERSACADSSCCHTDRRISRILFGPVNATGSCTDRQNRPPTRCYDLLPDARLLLHLPQEVRHHVLLTQEPVGSVFDGREDVQQAHGPGSGPGLVLNSLRGERKTTCSGQPNTAECNPLPAPICFKEDGREEEQMVSVTPHRCLVRCASVRKQSPIML